MIWINLSFWVKHRWNQYLTFKKGERELATRFANNSPNPSFRFILNVALWQNCGLCINEADMTHCDIAQRPEEFTGAWKVHPQLSAHCYWSIMNVSFHFSCDSCRVGELLCMLQLFPPLLSFFFFLEYCFIWLNKPCNELRQRYRPTQKYSFFQKPQRLCCAWSNLNIHITYRSLCTFSL